MTLIHPMLKYIIVAAYFYGASVHVANMAGISGFDWLQAPWKWQALDIFYLALDVMVVVGLLSFQRFGLCCFAIAAISQIILYTGLRSWVVDVPAELAPSPDQLGYLTQLVIFHVVTLFAVAGSFLHREGSLSQVS